MGTKVKNGKGFIKAVKAFSNGLKGTLGHLWEARKHPKVGDIRNPDYFNHLGGRVTLEYPKFEIPVPETGRYQLHNEMEDCIVCDKCAKICPVDCIEIIPIKSAEEIGKTSDGTTKRLYAEKFDIDMSKCCFCGLCTTVCPTECLTMTNGIDTTTQQLSDLTFSFGLLSPSEAESKKEAWQKHLEAKELLNPKAAPVIKSISTTAEVSTTEVEEQRSEKPIPPKPSGFRPKVKAVTNPTSEPSETPKVEPPQSAIPVQDTPSVEETPSAEVAPRPKPVFRPKVKAVTNPASEPSETPKVEPPQSDVSVQETPSVEKTPSGEVAPRPKPVFRPKVKAVTNPTSEPTEIPKVEPPQSDIPVQDTPSVEDTPSAEVAPRPRPVFRPKVKPLIKPNPEEGTNS